MELPEADRLEAAIFWLEEMTGGAEAEVLAYQRRYGIAMQQAKILAVLNAAAPRVVTRQQLYRALYPNDDEVTFKIVDVLVCRLRQALPPDSIVTQWGTGLFMPVAVPMPDLPERPPGAIASHEFWTARDDADLLRWHASGWTLDAMAEEIDRTPRAVEERLRRLRKSGAMRGPVGNARCVA